MVYKRSADQRNNQRIDNDQRNTDIVESGTLVTGVAKCFKELIIFGSFGLSTKEPYTIMRCPSCIVSVGIVGVCAHLS